ncbi:MAG: DUF4433 domain-containing protein [candidate division Zixibacteria bacterium]|nr:DUF4433 domain-containing protein [Candidatus Tariuqbacter arcticus]
MKISELSELHYIAPIGNIVSIMQRGILSHNLVKRIKHEDISNVKVQDRREDKVIPGGKRLHDYANLYFDARNPMLFYIKCQGNITEICILRIDKEILFLNGVVITDRNASSDYAHFEPAPEGLKIVDKELTYAKYWNADDEFEKMRRKSKRSAEVLVPAKVDPKYIFGAYVSCQEAKECFEAQGVNIPIIINSYMFFDR